LFGIPQKNDGLRGPMRARLASSHYSLAHIRTTGGNDLLETSYQPLDLKVQQAKPFFRVHKFNLRQSDFRDHWHPNFVGNIFRAPIEFLDLWMIDDLCNIVVVNVDLPNQFEFLQLRSLQEPMKRPQTGHLTKFRML